MTISSHGARKATGATTAAARLRGSMNWRRPLTRGHRFSSSNPIGCSSFPRRLSAARVKMEARDRPKNQAWHFSRGIVFAGGTKVVYPRLPMVRYYSDPAPVANDGKVSERSADEALRENSSEPDLAGSGVGQAPIVSDEGEASSAQEPAEPPKEEEIAPCNPPVSDLGYKIPEDIFQKGKTAQVGTPESFWSYSLYRGPNENGILDRRVKVHYCTSSHTTQRVLKQYFMDEKVLGFDLEWAENSKRVQGARRNVSLVQLASPSRIALFHLAVFPKGDTLVAPLLKQIMEDPNITKCGVWIKGDSTRMRTFLEVAPRGTFELSHLYKLVQFSANQLGQVDKKLVSLAFQVQDVLKLPLFKGDVRKSDWSQPLNMSQVIYSASDAYAAVQLFAVLDHQRRSLVPTPPLPHHAELNLPIQLTDQALSTSGEESGPEPVETDIVDISGETAAFTEYLNSINGINLEEESSMDVVTTRTRSMTTTIAAVVTKTTTTATTGTATAVTATGTVTKTSTTMLKKAITVPAKSPSKALTALIAKDPRVAEAHRWAEKSSKATSRARAYQLRAYYLWHKYEELQPGQLAALLRDPPLNTSTVCSYIMESIDLHGLPFDLRRLKEEVMPSVSYGRYGKYQDLSALDGETRAFRNGP